MKNKVYGIGSTLKRAEIKRIAGGLNDSAKCKDCYNLCYTWYGNEFHASFCICISNCTDTSQTTSCGYKCQSSKA
ncbi:MAG: hypothetical protein QM528_02190 [Phycisphaerales bacterium]|nr:hypothetical protein [Phycisphaerales bacterium]